MGFYGIILFYKTQFNSVFYRLKPGNNIYAVLLNHSGGALRVITASFSLLKEVRRA
jgi:hypothetical protein